MIDFSKLPVIEKKKPRVNYIYIKSTQPLRNLSLLIFKFEPNLVVSLQFQLSNMSFYVRIYQLSFIMYIYYFILDHFHTFQIL